MKHIKPSVLRNLLLNWHAIDNDGGPGTTNNRRGSWHLFCHLAAAAALYRLPNRCAAWVGILYDKRKRKYVACVCRGNSTGVSVQTLKSKSGRDLIARGVWAGYLEGASRGHILDRSAVDIGDPEKDDRRQDYDQNGNSPMDGGPVWEMWTISRDIRARNRLGTSLVEAYCDLLAALGGGFAAVVERGRTEPEYGHLRQMCAMIDEGFITPAEALMDIEAIEIPTAVERLLMQATPKAFALAADALAHTQSRPCYFMYERKLSSFAKASLLRRLVRTLHAVNSK